ncbi:MAG TPA: chromate transporter [Clostridiaceae bacterium]|nr:chromate transporter [Clostridiaceae bacterium]
MDQKIGIKDLFKIFITFFRIGAFTFGGGYAMLPIMQREVIDRKNWIKEEELIDIYAVSQSLPGVIAINSSTFIGYKLAKKKGAVAATLGMIMPSFIIITIIAMLFKRLEDIPIVQAIFRGIRPTVVALISTAAIKIAKSAIKDKVALLIAVAAFITSIVFDIHVIFIIIAGAILGIVLCNLFPGLLNSNAKKGVKNK